MILQFAAHFYARQNQNLYSNTIDVATSTCSAPSLVIATDAKST